MKKQVRHKTWHQGIAKEGLLRHSFTHIENNFDRRRAPVVHVSVGGGGPCVGSLFGLSQASVTWSGTFAIFGQAVAQKHSAIFRSHTGESKKRTQRPS